MANIGIPKGKQLGMVKGKTTIPSNGIPMILDEDITLSLSSSFKQLYGGKSNTLFDLAGSVSKSFFGIGFSSKFKEFGFQIWENTDPVSFNVTVTFHMGINKEYNAYTEVYKPAIELASLPLPTIGASIAGGLAENLEPPGPSPSTLLGGEKFSPISLQIGNILYISNIIVKKAEPTFSTETDEFDYPIWAKVNLDIQSVETATVEMITQNNIENTERGV